MATTSLYPLSIKEDLKKQFVGKSIKDVAVPAAVLDLGKVKNNCDRMLEAVESLDFSWRAHIKTHKVQCHLSLLQSSTINLSSFSLHSTIKQ